MCAIYSSANKQGPPKGMVYNFLKKSPMLQGVSEENISALAKSSVVKPFKKGSIIFRAEEPSNWIFFIYAGTVVEFVAYASSVDVIVKTRQKHDFIGEMGVLTGEPYPNTAVAMEAVVLIAVPKEVFSAVTWQTDAIPKFIIKQLVERLTNSAKKFVSSMYLDAPGRLALTLVALANTKSG